MLLQAAVSAPRRRLLVGSSRSSETRSISPLSPAKATLPAMSALSGTPQVTLSAMPAVSAILSFSLPAFPNLSDVPTLSAMSATAAFPLLPAFPAKAVPAFASMRPAVLSPLPALLR